MINKFNHNFISIDKISNTSNHRYLLTFKSSLDVKDYEVYVEIMNNSILEKINNKSYSHKLIEFVKSKGYGMFLDNDSDVFRMRIKCDNKGLASLKLLLEEFLNNDVEIFDCNKKNEKNNFLVVEELKKLAKKQYGISLDIKDIKDDISFPYKPPIDELKNLLVKIYDGIVEKIQEVKDLKIKNNKEFEENNKKLNIVFELAKLQGYDKEADFNEIKNFIFKNKYLNLAKALEDVRMDWNDGCWKIESALANFEISCDLDSDIDSEICVLIENFKQGNVDGRAFRDCTYNYNFLYSLVPKELIQINEIIED